MRAMAAIMSILLLTDLSSAQSQSAEHHDHHAAPEAITSPDDPPIRITINPEARVSVVLTNAPILAGRCGGDSEVNVRIINQGFITARLEAELVGSPPPGTAVSFDPDPLKGVAEEFRKLRLTLTRPGPTDLTITFHAKNGIPDLGGRDRIHFIAQCT